MSENAEVFRKNDEFTGLVESLGSNGEGIIHMNGTVFFAPYTVVGEKVKLRTLKVKNKIGYAKAVEILTPADERVRAKCPLFTKCGGCQIQHLRYSIQLKLKTKIVQDTLRKIAGIETEVPVTVKSEFQYEYRNKLQIPVGVDKNGNNVIGFYAERSHRIVPVKTCPIHPEWAEKVIETFHGYMRECGVHGYDEATGKGTLRHIVVRDVDGCFIVVAVTAGDVLPHAEKLKELLAQHFKTFSLWQNVNGGEGNGVFGETFRLLYGKPKFSASECGIRFEVGPNTFMQVNRGVCRKLYERTVRAAVESGAETVIDAYSGGGLLTAMLAKNVGKAYGIEVVREASECADALIVPNKLQGKMENICGKVEDELPRLLKKVRAEKTFLVADPARRGLDRGTVKAILNSGIPRMALISCNPATMARDVGLLTGALMEKENGELVKSPAGGQADPGGFYKITSVTPFDMFPQTKHIEVLICLERRQ